MENIIHLCRPNRKKSNSMHFTFKNSAAIIFASLLVACGEPAGEATTDTAAGDDSAVEEALPITYSLNTDESELKWKGQMLGMHSHEGTLNFTEGTVKVLNGEVVGGNFTVDMTSINPTDDGYNEENPKEKLVGHLSSPDFFDVENHPTASLELMEGGKAKLTVRGNTNEEMVTDIEMKGDENNMKASGKLTFDRTKYDVSFVHPVQEMVLSDDIELSIIVVASAL